MDTHVTKPATSDGLSLPVSEEIKGTINIKVWERRKTYECIVCGMNLKKRTLFRYEGEKYCLEHCLTLSEMQSLYNREMSKPIYSQAVMEGFLHGPLCRQQADDFLLVDGDFVVYWSVENCQIYLAAMWNSVKRHGVIPTTKDELFSLRGDSVSTLSEWIHRHMDSGKPINKSCTVLRNPILRQESLALTALQDKFDNVDDAENPTSVVRRHLQVNERSCSLVMSGEGVADLELSVTVGSICHEQVDVIVNSVGWNLKMSDGPLSRAVLENAGPEIQDELTRNWTGLDDNARSSVIVQTAGYQLPSKFVLHVILNSWNDEELAVQVYCELLANILTAADNLKASSLAIPPIGTGVLGYPRHIAAYLMYRQVTDYFDAHSDTSLQKIVFAVLPNDKELQDTFEKLLRNEQNDEDIKISQNMSQFVHANFITRANTLHSNSRRELPAMPRNWTLGNSSKKPFARIQLAPHMDTFQEVLDHFSTSEKQEVTRLIYKIERIENRRLFDVYDITKDAMQEEIEGREQKDVERLLWHGTSREAAESIIASGFNRIYRGTNGKKYGNGVYFAVDFSYSAQDAFSPPDSNGLKYLFLCKVLTGDYCEGTEGLLESPEKAIGSGVRYDSAVNDCKQPRIFVTFRDYSMYPAYLITLFKP